MIQFDLRIFFKDAHCDMNRTCTGSSRWSLWNATSPSTTPDIQVYVETVCDTYVRSPEVLDHYKHIYGSCICGQLRIVCWSQSKRLDAWLGRSLQFTFVRKFADPNFGARAMPVWVQAIKHPPLHAFTSPRWGAEAALSNQPIENYRYVLARVSYVHILIYVSFR